MLNAAYIERLGVDKIKEYGKDFKRRMNKRSKRMLSCLSYWKWDKYEANKVLDLQRVFRCKDLFCPNCRTWNAAKSIMNFNPYFRDLLAKGFCPYFLTLTVPNVKGDFLAGEIDKLNQAFRKLWRWLSYNNVEGYKNRLFDAVVAIRALELTVNESRYDVNVHIHVIIFLINDNKNDFYKRIPGGYRKKSNECIYYSNADIFI